MTEEWWDRFVEALNASTASTPLSWSGGICFGVASSYKAPVWIVWASKAHHVPGLVTGFPRLNASEADWRALIGGELDARAGLSSGRIKYMGSLLRTYQVIEILEAFARVAKGVSEI